MRAAFISVCGWLNGIRPSRSGAHRLPTLRTIGLAAFALLAVARVAEAQANSDAGPPLHLEQVIELARHQRAEIAAARSRARAASARPELVSALEDPMVFASIDHLPFMLGGVDGSLVIEQRFPLSRIRGHRRGAADADARRSAAEVDRVQLDVELEATTAFVMVREARQMAAFADAQQGLARQVAAAATATYGVGRGSKAEVLRAEIEVARLEGEAHAKAAEVRAAEVMLNLSIGRDPDVVVPELAPPGTDAPPTESEVTAAALAHRPELRVGRAEIERARADVSVMQDMYRPMAMVQTGPSYTMADGPGWMLMVGVSVPIWRGKLRAGVAEAAAMSEMAAQDLIAMRRMVVGDVIVARADVVAARIRWLALRDQVVPRATAAIEPTLSAYATGQLPLVSVLEAAQTLWEVQMELAAAERDLGLAWARLARATANGARS